MPGSSLYNEFKKSESKNHDGRDAATPLGLSRRKDYETVAELGKVLMTKNSYDFSISQNAKYFGLKKFVRMFNISASSF